MTTAKYHTIFLLLFAFLSVGCNAVDESSVAHAKQWSWKIAQSDMYASLIAVELDSGDSVEFAVSCGLDNQDNDASATVEKIAIDGYQNSLLLVHCSIGAHSQLLMLFDPLVSDAPVFEQTGAYYVSWEVEKDRLKIGFDRRCFEEDQVNCNSAGFRQLEHFWP